MRKFLTLIFICIVCGCSNSDKIKIGFAGPLTGKASGIGVFGRNGAELAINEVNAAGGIRGRMVELIVKDDANSPDKALIVDTQLADAGVSAIIGHMTSGVIPEILPFINKKKMLMISPTVSSMQFSGIDDYFLRVMAPNDNQADKLAVTSIRKGSRTISCVYDDRNRAYSTDILDFFKKKYESLGGKVVFTEKFEDTSVADFYKLALKLRVVGSDSLLIISNPIDAAVFCQQIRKIGYKPTIYLPGWALTRELIENGGVSVEGIYLASIYYEGNTRSNYLSFVENYKNKYHEYPSFSAVHSYEALKMLFKGLEASNVGSSDKLKEQLLKIKQFNGLQNDFVIDKYGDSSRECFLTTVKNGKFVLVNEK